MDHLNFSEYKESFKDQGLYTQQKSLIKDTLKFLTDKTDIVAERLPSENEKRLIIIADLFKAVILEGVETTNTVIADIGDNQKLTAFHNVDSHLAQENPILFVQVFLETGLRNLNILTDPYLMVNGDPLLGEIELYASAMDGRTETRKIQLTEDQVPEKLFNTFLALLKNFLARNLKPAVTAYAS